MAIYTGEVSQRFPLHLRLAHLNQFVTPILRGATSMWSESTRRRRVPDGKNNVPHGGGGVFAEREI